MKQTLFLIMEKNNETFDTLEFPFHLTVWGNYFLQFVFFSSV